MKCNKKCEIYSRVVGYHRPVQNWNLGKKSEFAERLEFDEKVSLKSHVVPAAGKIKGSMETAAKC